MGGAGSGMWPRLGTKRTTEEFAALDVRYLQRNGLLRLGRRTCLAWWRDGSETSSILLRAEDGRIVFEYLCVEGMCGAPRHVVQPVGLLYTGCTLGGRRPWFECPGRAEGACGRRVAILYGSTELFLCRHCLDLTYESQREDAGMRAVRRAQRIRLRLGGSPNLSHPIPDKPERMHVETYQRLAEAALQAELEALGSINRWLDRYQDR